MAKEQEIKAASESVLHIKAGVIDDILEFAPTDGFRLDSKYLGQDYTVVDVMHSDFGGKKTFNMLLQNQENIITLSAGMLKKARVLAVKDYIAPEEYKDNSKVYLKSKADALWNGSRFYHTQAMKKGKAFDIPPTIYLEAAILREENGKEGVPKLNPFYYEGYRTVVDHYALDKKKKFPNMDDFRAELKKVGDKRIEGLPAKQTEQPYEWVQLDKVASYTHNLILKDRVAAKGE